MRDAATWAGILAECKVSASHCAKWAPIFASVIDDKTFSLGDSEIDDFLGNILHESARLSKLEESLFYSRERIIEIGANLPVGTRWRYVADRADRFAKNPVAMANALYGGRFGNDTFGDGWKYRGSGLIMVTFKDNYAELQRITGLPLIDTPELLRKPGEGCLRVCVAWWEGKVPDRVMGDRFAVRKAVQGGSLGAAEVAAMTNSANLAMVRA